MHLTLRLPLLRIRFATALMSLCKILQSNFFNDLIGFSVWELSLPSDRERSHLLPHKEIVNRVSISICVVAIDPAEEE